MSLPEHKPFLAGMSFTDGNVAESWKRFKQRLYFYFKGVVSNKLTDQRKLGVLMTALGDQGLDVFNTFQDLDESSRFEDVMDAFEEYCNPRRNTVYERFLFSQIAQGSRNVDAFVVELKNQASRCEFGDQSDSLVRDRVVVGVRNPLVRKELLRDAELTLQTAVEIARAWERSDLEATAMAAPSPSHVSSYSPQAEPMVVDRVDAARPTRPTRKCANCPYDHPPDRCPATDRECNYCKKKGHFAAACRKRPQGPRPRPAADAVTASSDSTAAVAEPNAGEATAATDDLQVLHICTLRANATRVWRVSIRVGSQTVPFKIDTGAECNVLTYRSYLALSPRPPLSRTLTRLRAYGAAQVIVPRGEIAVSCVINRKPVKLSFIVVEFEPESGMVVENLIGLPSIVECQLVQLVSPVACDASAPLAKPPSAPVLREFADVFGGLGKVPGVYDFVVREGSFPVVEKPRRFPFSVKSKLCDALRGLERQGVIQRVEEPTDWVSNLIVVRKPSGDLRICLDPRNLNRAILIPKFEIPKTDDILVQLQGCRYFTVLDLKNGFWQLELSAKSSLLTTFNSPLGRYRFLRMCFGVSSAPEIFMGAIVKFFGDLPGVCPYFDDLIVTGATAEEHDVNLRRVLVRARECNIRFNAEKIQFRQSAVNFLGFEVSPKGIKPLPKHTRAVNEMPAPRDRKGVLRLLGMVRYLSRFIPDLAQLTENLRNLTKKSVEFLWTAAHETEFSKLKSLITSATTLRFYDQNAPLYVQTDSSKSGIGCCLFQSQAPIAYASRALTATECRYAQIEKELLAVVYALEHFNEYTYGREVIVRTDHKPLLALVRKPIADVTPRLQRLCLRLMRYTFQLQYQPGRELLVADALSRAYLENEPADESYQTVDVHSCQRVVASPENYQLLAEATRTDPEMEALRVYLRGGWPKSAKRYTPFLSKCRTFASELSFVGDLCFFRNRLFVPSSCIPLVLSKLHEGHLNVVKTKRLAQQSVFWLTMQSDIDKFVGRCSECARFTRNNSKEPLKSFPLCSRPWERLHMDILTHESKDFLVIYDAYSYWLELFPLRSKLVSEVSMILANLFARFGVPSHVVSDNSPFHSESYLQFARKWGFVPLFTSPRYPQSNGMAEKAVAIAKSLLRKNPSDLPAALLQYRNAPVPHIGYSPAQLLMSRVLNGKFVFAEEQLVPTVVDAPLVRQRKLRQMATQSYYYDRTAAPLPAVTAGESVLYKKELSDAEWKPAIVVEQAPAPRSFVVRDEATGATYLRNRRFLRKPARFAD